MKAQDPQNDVTKFTSFLKEFHLADIDIADTTDVQTLRTAWTMFKGIVENGNSRDIHELIGENSGIVDTLNWLNEIYYALMNFNENAFLIEVAQYLLEHIDLEDLCKSNWQRGLADAYDELGDYDKAVSIYESYLNDFPKNGNLYFGYCLLLEKHKDIHRLGGVITTYFNLEMDEYNIGLYDVAKRVAKKCDDKAWFKNISKQYKQLSEKFTLRKIHEIKMKNKETPKALLLPLEPIAYENAQPNKPCPCGSGKRFKTCCKKKLDKIQIS